MKTVSDFFIPFVPEVSLTSESFCFNDIFSVHPLCKIAAEDLQSLLQNQSQWNHNFGLSTDTDGAVIGKMFGVLVVENDQKEIGYLAAFSGKLAGQNHLPKFVPPVFDGLADDSFVNDGMRKLTSINNSINKLEEDKSFDHSEQIEFLIAERKDHSVKLQERIFDNYNFLNSSGQQKSLKEIFHSAGYKNPPSGAGECAAPKLLQYAFLNNLKPIALAEFWWGLSPKSDTWKHKQFYRPCKEKCEPILKHMLEGCDDIFLK